jgi:hypothetical protein
LPNHPTPVDILDLRVEAREKGGALRAFSLSVCTAKCCAIWVFFDGKAMQTMALLYTPAVKML